MTESTKFEDLLHRLVQLDDERAINALFTRYGQSYDSGDESGFVSCFTTDGALIAVRADGQATVLGDGRDGLTTFFRERHPLDTVIRHFIASPRIVISGDQATCSSYWFVLTVRENKPALYGVGRYQDELRRQPDGQWLLSQRRAIADPSVI